MEALLNGGRLGRPKGSTKIDEPRMVEIQDIIIYLKKGYTIRDTAKLTGKSISSVQRTKKAVANI